MEIQLYAFFFFVGVGVGGCVGGLVVCEWGEPIFSLKKKNHDIVHYNVQLCY